MRTLPWITFLGEVGVVLAGLLLILAHQYQVASLAGYDVTLDVLFLGSVAAVVILRRLGRPGGRGALVNLTFAVVVVALTLAGGEYATRFAFRNVTSSGNVNDFIARRGGGPSLVTNSLGFREREITPKRPGQYRIAAIGDSITWANGVEVSDRFSNRIEASLGSPYEVLNFGVPGNNLPEHVVVLEQALLASPDFVILELFVNDFETPSMTRPQSYPLLPRAADRSLRRSSLFYTLLSMQWEQLQGAVGIADSYSGYMAKNLLNENAWNAVETMATLHQFVANARMAGVPVGIVVFPAFDSMGAYGAHYPFAYLDERIQAFCAHEKVLYLDLLPVFSEVADPHALWVSPFDAHPNAAAHHRAATEIVKAFGAAWHR